VVWHAGGREFGTRQEVIAMQTPTLAQPAQPLWPYTWGRAFRRLDLPLDLLYRAAVTRTIVLGGERLADLPPRVIFAGTHHSFADVPLLQHGLTRTPARRLAGRLAIAAAADGFGAAGLYAKYAVLALGLYPLRRDGEGEASLRGLARLAEAGNALLIFPQGAHVRPAQERAGDRAARFHCGVAYLAAALDAAVVPFGVAGTERAMPPFLEEFDGRVVAGIPVSFARGPLAIAFGAPLRRAPGETARAFTVRLQAASYALTREAERAVGACEA
jgi:1-acyl-sn-glycerol-3-phosphate acyltransferase